MSYTTFDNNSLDEMKFIDNGFSGSNLNRPALERLRDKIFSGEIDKIYIHSPDRLSRKYAYQMILLEEFQKGGAEIIFLNHQNNDTPESHLLLQVQGMIAEYERAKIMERHRRGKIHAAKSGSINVLGGAPYGFRYINRSMGGGEALYEINVEEAEIVQKIFFWVGYDRITMNEVCCRLKKGGIPSPKGKAIWNRSVILSLLKNPAYKGTAAFGKTKIGPRLPRIRQQRHLTGQPKHNYSIFPVEKEKWIYIPVPAIIDEVIFEAVQKQIEENKKTARTRRNGATYLLQGLIVCRHCNYAFYGKPVQNKRGDKIDSYAYYRCIGTDGYRFNGNKICNNKQIRTDVLEIFVWEEVKFLLKNPVRILDEYERRINELERSPLDHTKDSLEKQENKLNRGINRLIDSYAQEHIEKEEFEPRIKAMKQRLKTIEEQKQQVLDKKHLKNEMKLIVTQLENFAFDVETKLENINWHAKRDIIRALVKRVEIGTEEINVVFRVRDLPGSNRENQDYNKLNLQHCGECRLSGIG
ncbi:MAG: recombinase family protein [Silvanigrellaceae bacterium]|nr:recombinase family protein [Silvanigrellaceae bacterium]